MFELVELKFDLELVLDFHVEHLLPQCFDFAFLVHLLLCPRSLHGILLLGRSDRAQTPVLGCGLLGGAGYLMHIRVRSLVLQQIGYARVKEAQEAVKVIGLRLALAALLLSLLIGDLHVQQSYLRSGTKVLVLQ